MTFTADFTTAAKAVYRDPRSRISIQWNSSTTSETLVSITNDENRAALMPQVTNGKAITTRKWAYLSTGLGTNELIADGSFFPMPDDLINGEVGWYGATASDSNGEWVTDPELEITYAEASLTGAEITITCDTVYNEYPVDYAIQIFNGVSLEFIDLVTGNASPIITVDLTGQTLNKTDKIIFTVQKWSAAYGIVKIVEFNINTTIVYHDDEIVNIDILKEVEYDSGSIPIGNISSNQLNLKLVNTDFKFSHGNTNSPLHNLLLKDRKIQVWLGFVLPTGSSDVSSGDYIVETINGEKVGFVPMGIYYSDDWITDRRSLTCKTTARDIFDKLRETEFRDSDVYVDYTLYALAEVVLTKANNKFIEGNEDPFTWIIDDSLKLITIPFAYFPKTNFLAAIKQIAQLGQTTAFVDRLNVIRLGVPLN